MNCKFLNFILLFFISCISNAQNCYIPHKQSLHGSLMQVADLNSDGKEDLLVKGNKSIVRHFETTPVTFTTSTTELYEYSPTLMLTADFNGDNKPDLLTTRAAWNDLYIAINGGTTYTTTINGFFVDEIITGDFNNDTKLDMVFCMPLYNNGSIQVLLGNGNGTFQPIQTYASEPIYKSLKGDFNKDGNLDILINSGKVLLGDGTGKFITQSSFTYDGSVDDMASYDLNNDLLLDLVVSGKDKVAVFFGQGDGTFNHHATYTVSEYQNVRVPYYNYLAIGDLNKDGVADLVVACGSLNTVVLFTGKEDGTFVKGASYVTDEEPYYPIIKDFNGDSYVDFAVATKYDMYFMLNSNTQLAAPIISENEIKYCTNESAAILTATGSNLTWSHNFISHEYAWNMRMVESQTPVTGVNNNTIYHVDQTVDNCQSAVSTILVKVETCTGLVENELSAINFYPNPVNEVVHVTLPIEIQNGFIEILNTQGKVVYTQRFDSNKVLIKTDLLNNGIYFFKAYFQGKLFTKTFVK